MTKKTVNYFIYLCAALLLFLSVSGVVNSQQKYRAPETILPESVIKMLIDEISGQLALNNEIMMAGYNHIRPPEEFNTFFYESDYLAKKLKEYGLDEVRLEDVGKSYAEKGATWWARVDAELTMKEPEQKRLSRLAEHPALMARFSDSGEWEGEAVYLDARDTPRLKELDLKGKIIVTPEYPLRFREAFANGALGVVSYYNGNQDLEDPYQVVFNMRFDKGEAQQPVFCFQIWRQLGEQLKELLFREQKVVLHAMAKTASYPLKYNSVLACINGTDPHKKGLMFTAHLFERPVKQGANDNVSGCVTLAEIARALTTLIKQGKLPRPERSVYFLMTEEGSGTMAFFKQYPEMADKVLAAINMDMVGEDMGKNQAFWHIEKPFYSRTSFLEPLAVQFSDYVFQTNTDRPGNSLYDIQGFPVPILDKNGSNQPFRYYVSDFVGASDHGMFIETDCGIPAIMFSVWPDKWFHSDKDRPDKSDTTQLKRAAFIGTASALAIASGNEEILQNLVKVTYQDRLALIQQALSRSIDQVSALTQSDGGQAYANGINNIRQAALLGKQTLSYLRDLTQGKPRLDSYLQSLERGITGLAANYTKILEHYYADTAALKGFKPEKAVPTAEERKLEEIIPVKIKPVPLGENIRFSKLSPAIRKDPNMILKFYREYGLYYLMELFFSIDGRKSLAQVRDLLSYEFRPMPAADFMKIINGLVEEKLIKLNKK